MKIWKLNNAKRFVKSSLPIGHANPTKPNQDLAQLKNNVHGLMYQLVLMHDFSYDQLFNILVKHGIIPSPISVRQMNMQQAQNVFVILKDLMRSMERIDKDFGKK